MRTWGLIGSLVLMAASTARVEAAGPGGGASLRARRLFTKTITTTVYEATLESTDTGAEPDATGFAQYVDTTVEITILGRPFAFYATSLTVHVNDLDTTNEPDGTILTFFLDSDTTPFASTTTTNGTASVRLSLLRGDSLPTITGGETLTVHNEDSDEDLVAGDFDDGTTTTTYCR
jgi:hypothetical protein